MQADKIFKQNYGIGIFWLVGALAFMGIRLGLKSGQILLAEQNQSILSPDYGCYVGIFPGWGELEDSVSSQQLIDLEQLSGKSVAFSPFSVFWGENSVSSQQLDEMANYGAVPQLRLMPWGEPYWKPAYQPDYSLQKIIDGDFDQFLSDWADQIKIFSKSVMVTFGVEMNGDWFPWSGVFQGGDATTGFGDPNKADGPERYIAAFRHIVNLFRSKGITNVTWYFQPNHESYPDEIWNSIEAYYPGDDYIDWVGVSVYGAQYIDESWHSFETLMDPVYNRLTSLFQNKPLMLAEWGVGEYPDKGDKADWYAEALTKIQSKYTLMKIAIVYHERWQNDDGTWSDLRINSSSEALSAYKSGISSDYFLGGVTPPSPRSILDSGDYNGDGTSDIAVFRGSQGLWSVKKVTRCYFGSSGDLPVPGDYDGDGTTNIAIYRGKNGLWVIRGITRFHFGSSDDRPVLGDYDGDGCCDIGIFRNTSCLWVIRGLTRTYFGTEGDWPVPGDYGGDGTKDIAIFRRGSGLWVVREISRIYFGTSRDQPVPGDYDGDGTEEAGVFRKSSGLWVIRGVTRCYFGSSSHQPVPADYDGDFSDEIGVFRSGTGFWALREITRLYYGSWSDLPVTR